MFVLTDSHPPLERVEGLVVGNPATYLCMEALTEEEFLARLEGNEFHSAIGHRPLALYLTWKLEREVRYNPDEYDPLHRLEYGDFLFVAQVRGLRQMQESVPVEEQILRVERAVKTFCQVSNATIMAVGGHDHC